MGWAFGSGIQIRIDGVILQELNEDKYKPLFIQCASMLDELRKNGKFNCPEGNRLPFFKEFKYYLDLTSEGVFSFANDITFVEVFEKKIVENEGIYSPVDMFKVLLLLNAFGKEYDKDIWFGAGSTDGCLLFGAFYNKKLEYIKIKKNQSEEEEEGNAFTCSKKEMELFFSEPHTTWIH
jgi:hypothetical protein